MVFLHKISVLIYLLVFPFILLSQKSQTTDSLIRLLADSEQDTVRLGLFIELSNKIEKKDSLKKFAYADSALTISKSLQKQKYLAFSLKNKAWLFQTYKNYNDAIAFYKKTLFLFEKIGNKPEMATANYELGRMYYRVNKPQKSLDLHKKALETRNLLNDTSKIIESETAVAIMLWRLGELNDAEKHFLRSLQLSKKINDIKSTSPALNSLGAIYWGLGRFNKALEYYETALAIAKKTNNNINYALVVNNIGLVYQEWGKNGIALENYRDGLKVSKKINYLKGIAYSYNNIGKIHQLNKEYKTALANFDSSLVNYKRASKKMGIAFTYRRIGDVYFKMGDTKKAIEHYSLAVKTATEVNSKNHLAKALSALAKAYFKINDYSSSNIAAKKSLSISLDNSYRNIAKDNYFTLSRLAETSGNQTVALRYYKLATTIKDSIFNEKSSKQIAEMQAKYETEKKERENALLREKEQQKNIKLTENKIQIRNQHIFIVFFVIGLSILIITVYALIKNQKKLLISQKLLTKKNEEINNQSENLIITNSLLNEKTQSLEKNEKELNKTILELKKATDFKNKMFSIIGHDLRGPIGTISSIISFVMKKRLSDEKRLELLAATKDSAVATFTLLENLLTWANNERGKIAYKPEKIKLKQIANKNIDLLTETASNKNIAISSGIENDIEVFADLNTLDTIIRNLLSNAIKYTNENGKVSISAVKTSNSIEISVNDTGVGMSPKDIAKVLDPDNFFTDTGTQGEKGSGIGLQLCFEFIKLNNGTYKIISEIGKGTSFIFNLPYKK